MSDDGAAVDPLLETIQKEKQHEEGCGSGPAARSLLSLARWPHFGLLHQAHPRKCQAWADVMYFPHGRLSHVVPFGGRQVLDTGGTALCGREPWLGTGSQDEWDKARRMPLCVACAAEVKKREWVAGLPTKEGETP